MVTVAAMASDHRDQFALRVAVAVDVPLRGLDRIKQMYANNASSTTKNRGIQDSHMTDKESAISLSVASFPRQRRQ